jgi:hypothetical protein
MAMLVGWEGATLKTSQKTCRRMFELSLRVTGKSYKIIAEKCRFLAEYLFGDVEGVSPRLGLSDLILLPVWPRPSGFFIALCGLLCDL